MGAAWPAGLVEAYQAERLPLLRIAFVICWSRTDAEDAVQEAVIKAARNWDHVDNASAYLRAAVVNVARDGVRKRERRRARDVIGAPDSRVGQLDIAEEDRALAQALARLPEPHRCAIVLRFYADWSNDEIARCLDKRAVTVRSWIHRGLTQLRRDLADER